MIPNQDKIKILIRREMSKFGENLNLDEIEGAEFGFVGLETRLERNRKTQFLTIGFEF